MANDDYLPLTDLPERLGPSPGTQHAMTLARMLVPGLYNYFTQPVPPPQITPNAAGKVPPADYNPNTGPALQDISNLAMTAVAPEARAGVAAGEAIPAITRAAAEHAGSLRSVYDAATNAVGLAGGVGAVTPSPAEAAGRPTVDPDEATQVDALKKEIAGLSAQRIKATKDLGPKGAAVQAATYDAQIAQRNSQIDRIMGQVAGRQNAYDQQQEDYAKAGQPFSVREGDLVNKIRTGSLGASALTGLVRGAKRMGMAGSLLGGGVEGAAGVLFPSAVDITKPEDTEAYKTTQRNLFDNPSFWTRTVAPDAVYGAILAGAGHGIGHAIGAPIARTEARAAIPPAAPVPAALPAPASMPDFPLAAQGKVWPSDYRQIQMAKDVNGNWYEQGTGHKVPKNLWPPDKPGAGKSAPR